MSEKSNNNGRAYEYICLMTLFDSVKDISNVKIIENSALNASKRAWESIDENTKNLLEISAKTATENLFNLEPLILDNSNQSDILGLKIQSDENGINGDVRDIVIFRDKINWEIGLSLKHNHFAVKHSRLSKSLDFGNIWFGIPCSQNYWSDIKEIFNFLENEKRLNKTWSSLGDIKAKNIYIPLLQAFINEIKRSYEKDKNLPKKMVEYLLGEFDFYKIISIDNKKITQIQAFNLHGKLGNTKQKAKILVPIVSLPTRIVKLDFVPNSDNKVELYLDNGWQFSFRIHNASSKIESSLKFDIQIIGMPANILIIDCPW